MNQVLIEFALGLYFIGQSIAMSRILPNATYTKSVDVFKLGFGIVLFILALLQGVRVI